MTNVLFRGIANGFPFIIRDVDNYRSSGVSCRLLELSEGVASAVCFNPLCLNQPYMMSFQEQIRDFTSSHPVSEALILGCGGCAIPRFLLTSYPQIHITGIEKSHILIECAKQFFLFDISIANFDLINGDAFSFISSDSDKKYDIILVDLFDGAEFCRAAASFEFINALSFCCKKDAIIGFNISTAQNDTIKTLLDNLKKCNLDISHFSGFEKSLIVYNWEKH